MNAEQEERFLTALDGIAQALTRMAAAQEETLKREYPGRKKPEPATITKVKTEEDLIREDQGATGEQSMEDWMNIEELGPREREYLRRQEESRQTENPSPRRSEPGKAPARPAAD